MVQSSNESEAQSLQEEKLRNVLMRFNEPENTTSDIFILNIGACAFEQ